MLPDELPVVCLAVSDAYDDDYIARLQRMLERHCPIRFTLHCLSDRPRRAPAAVNVQVLDDWAELERPGMRQTTKKLRLFGQRHLPRPAFLYLDLTLVIRRDMHEFLDYAFARPEDLVIVRDWNHPGFNSSVMRVRTGALGEVVDAFIAGDRFVQKVPGDQDFLYACLAARGLLGRAATFPEGQVISYKLARRLSRTDAAAAAKQLAGATIVKFHGDPKPHEVLGSFWQGLGARMKPGGSFGRSDLRAHWRA